MLVPFAFAAGRLGHSRVTAYRLAGDLLPDPIHVGVRAMIQLAEEKAMTRALAAGFDEADQRELVRRLHEGRKRLASEEAIFGIVEGLQNERLARRARPADQTARSGARRAAIAQCKREVTGPGPLTGRTRATLRLR